MPERAAPVLEPLRRAEPVVNDPDASRATQTERLVRHVAPLLGLRVEDLRIFVDDASERVTRQHHAHALQHRRAIYVYPGEFDPTTPPGKYLLGHELTHQAQRDRHGPARTGTREEQALAEIEADEVGRAIAQSTDFAPPSHWLPFDQPAAVEMDAFARLNLTVETSREREIKRIKDLVDGFWISDRDVDRVLLTLQDMDFFTARSVIRSDRLSQYRVDLVDNINAHHHKRFRPEILACYAALSPEELRKFDERLLTGLDLRELSDEEHYAVFHVLQNMTPEVRNALAKSNKAFEIQAILGHKPALDTNVDARLKKADEEEAGRVRDEAADARQFRADPQLAADRRFVLDKMNDFFVSDAKALSALDVVAKYVRDPDKIRALAREMEDAGALDRLIRELPIKALFEEFQTSGGRTPKTEAPRRKAFLMLVSYRPAYKNIELAEKLTPTGFFGHVFNVMTDEDAYLAFQLLKAVPQKSRRSFMDLEGGDKWKRVLGEMTQSMRESESMNFYTGGKGQLDKASVEAPLLDPALWQRDRLSELDGRIRMAIAAGDHFFVWQQSERVRAYARAGLEPIVEKYRLYNPNAIGPDGKRQPRELYSPEVLKGTAFWEEGIFDVAATLGRGLALASKIQIGWGTVSTDNLSVEDIQNLLGGNVSGVRFKTQEEIQREESASGKSRARSNFIDKLVVDAFKREAVAEARNLEIAAIRYFYGDLLVQTGESRLKGLKVYADFRAYDDGTNLQVTLDVDSLELHDILRVSGDSMTAINSATIRGVRVAFRSTLVNFANLGQARTAAGVNVPLLSPVAASVAIAPGSPNDKPALTSTASYTVAADSISLQGITTSSGQHVESVELSGVAYRSGDGIIAYARALRESLASFPARIAYEQRLLDATTSEEERATRADAIAVLNKRREGVRKSLDHVNDDLAEIEKLERKRKSPGGLSEQDKRTLSRLQRGGATFDANSLKIHGISGTVSAGDIDLFNLHGHGQLARYEPEAEGRPVISSLDDPSGLAIEVGQFKTRNLALKQSPPSAESLDKQIARLEAKLNGKPPGYEMSRKLTILREKLADVTEYERLAKVGAAEMSVTDRERFVALRDKLFADSGITVADVALEGAVVDLDFAGGLGALADLRGNLKKVALTADAVKLQDVAIARTGVHLDVISAAGLHVGLEQRDKHAALTLGASGIVVEGLNLKRTKETLQDQAARLKKGKAPLSTADEHKLQRIDAALAQLDSLLGELFAAEEDLGTAWGTLGEARAAEHVKAVQTRLEQWQQQLLAERISVTQLDVSVADLGDIFSDDYDFDNVLDRGVAITGGFAEAEITGGQMGGTGARSVKLGAASGTVIYGTDSIQIKDFRLGSLAITGLDYSGGGRSVSSVRTTLLQGITADASIAYQRSPEGDVTATSLNVTELAIQSIVADQLHYEDHTGEQTLTVDIPSGALNLVSLSNFNVTIPADPDKPFAYSGDASVGTVDKLKVIAAVEGGLKASGTLNGSNLSARFMSDGAQQINLGDLSLEGGEVQYKGSKIKVNVTRLKGNVQRTPDGKTLFSIPDIQSIRVPFIDWHSGSKSVFSEKPLVLSGIAINGQLRQDTKAEKGKLDEVVVSRLHVNTISAEYLRYWDKESNLKVEIKPDAPEQKEPANALRVEGVELTDLRWTPKAGVTGAKLDVAHIASTIAVSMGQDLAIGAKLDARGLNVQLSKGGKLVASAEDLAGEIKGTAGGKEIKASVNKLKGRVTVNENSIGIDGLSVGLIKLNRFTYDTPRFGLTVLEGGDVSFIDTSASVTVYVNPVPQPGELPPRTSPPPRVRSIVIDWFQIPRITGTGLKVSLPTVGSGFGLLVPKGRTMTLTNFRLDCPEGEAGPFTIQPNNAGDWEMLGSAKLATADIDKVFLDMTRTFTGSTRLHAENGVVEFQGRNGPKVDLSRATLSEISGYLTSSELVASGRLPKVGAKEAELTGIHVSETGDVKVDQIAVGGLQYDDSGVHVDIQNARIPKGIDLKPGEPIHIDKFEITAAKFHIDDVMKLGGGGSGRSSLVPLDLTVLDHLNGHVNADMHMDIEGAGKEFMKLRMNITNGEIDYKAIEHQLPFLLDAAVDFDADPDTSMFVVTVKLRRKFEAPIPRHDLPRALPKVGPRGQPIGPQKIKLSILYHGRAIPGSSDEGSPLRDLFVQNIDVKLDLTGVSDISFGTAGRLRFGAPGKDGVVGLTAKGSTSNGVRMGIEQVNASIPWLKIGDARLSVGAITINKAAVTNLSFARFIPQTLDGTIESAIAENITVMQPKKSAP